MSRQGQGALLIGMVSQSLAVSVMFVAVSAVFSGGTETAMAFFFTSLVLCVPMFIARLVSTRIRERGFLFLGVALLAGGMGITIGIGQYPNAFLLLLFAAASLFLLHRLIELCMLDNAASMRQLLLEQYRLDVITLIALSVLALFLARDSTWQSTVVPLFVSFLLTRMLGLSLISRLSTGADKRSVRAGRLSFLLVGGAVIGGWILNAFGIPVFKSLLYGMSILLKPLFYIVGYVGTFVSEWLLANSKGTEDVEKMLDDMRDDQAAQQAVNGDTLSPANLDWIVYGLTCAICVVLIWFIYNRLKQRRVDGITGENIEVREFIRFETDRKPAAAAYAPSGPLTPVRALYRQFLLNMKKNGYPRYNGETALEYVYKISSARPELKGAVQELTDYYMQERYGDKSVGDKQQRMEQLKREIAQKNAEKD